MSKKNLKLNYVEVSDLIRKAVDEMVASPGGYAYAAGYLSSALTSALMDAKEFVVRDLQQYLESAEHAKVNKK